MIPKMLNDTKNPAPFDGKNPPFLTLKKRHGVLSVPDLRRAGAATEVPERKRMALLGLLFLWHDHWTEAHAAAHEGEGDADYDLLHALVHRREGDYGNSEYWLRETGAHPLFSKMDRKAAPLLAADEALREKILRQGKWSAAGYVAAIKSSPDHPLLREIQAEEFLCFYECLAAPAS